MVEPAPNREALIQYQESLVTKTTVAQVFTKM
jgi:hypothetical protein